MFKEFVRVCAGCLGLCICDDGVLLGGEALTRTPCVSNAFEREATGVVGAASEKEILCTEALSIRLMWLILRLPWPSKYSSSSALSGRDPGDFGLKFKARAESLH